MTALIPGVRGGGGGDPPLLVDGVLPPDLQGTLVRIGPGGAGAGGSAETAAGALHAVELRDGQAVSYRTQATEADANVFWHAGSLLALPESGVPLQYSRGLEPEEFAGGLEIAVASHAKGVASSGRRVVFGVEQGAETTTLRLGEWAPDGSLASAQSVGLERATWQHDLGVTDGSIVFIESPTEPLGAGAEVAVDFRWVPGAEGWVGLVPRVDGVVEDAAVEWFTIDPGVVTHVMGAHDDENGHGVVLYVCAYPSPEKGQPVDIGASVVGPPGIGMSQIGDGLGVLERWRVRPGERLEREQLDDRFVEYPRIDAHCEGSAFRYGYGVETSRAAGRPGEVDHLGLSRFDVVRGEVTTWVPGAGLTASEPVFVRAADGRGDDEGWLLTMVDDAGRAGTDLYVLDASSFGARRVQAVVHLPDGVRLPFRSHGEWVAADRYR